MLTVTDAALEHLQHALTRVEAASACFRLTINDQDTLGLIVEEPESGDRTYECDGETVLATPEPLVEFLSERILDLDDDGHLVLVPKSV
jgi:Fe-S cluster assembly iron-binding protein IscA